MYTAKGPEYLSINNAIAALAEQLNYEVIDWASYITAHPTDFSLDPEMKVHETTTLGYKNEASYVVSQIGKPPVETAPTPITTPATSPQPAPSNPEAATSNEDLTQQLMRYLVHNLGYSIGGASAILGNFQLESGLNPERLESSPYGSQTPASSLTPYQRTSRSIGWGMAQFTPSEEYLNYADQMNQDPNSPFVQTLFVSNQISKGSTLDLILRDQSTNPEYATEMFEKYYERPQGSNYTPMIGAAASSLQERQTYARAIYNTYEPILNPPVQVSPTPPAIANPTSTPATTPAPTKTNASSSAISTTDQKPVSKAPDTSAAPLNNQTASDQPSTTPAKPTGKPSKPTGQPRANSKKVQKTDQ